MKAFVSQLQSKLKEPLPGFDAHRLMMPGEVNRDRFDYEKLKAARPSSVLIMFYEKDNEIHIPLTLRHDYGGTHSGQVSFPGGKWEPTDRDLIHTATRETHEEIGIDPNDVNVIGQLSDLFIPPSNFRVTPVVSYIAKPPQFIIDHREVKELLEVPISRLLDKQLVKTKSITVRGGIRLNAPYFDVDGHVVWGATAMMLSELLSIIKLIK